MSIFVNEMLVKTMAIKAKIKSEEKSKPSTNSSAHETITTAKTKFFQNGIEREISITLDESWFEEDSEFYDHHLGRFCSQFSMLGYHMPKELTDPTDFGLVEALEALGMSDIEFETYAKPDQVNYFIAQKKIGTKDNEHTLVFSGFIGSYTKQWYTNFDCGTGKVHKGFNNAKNYAYDRLRRYLEKIDEPRKKIKLLLTGHSRGAAVCNLIAASLIKDEIYALKENIFAYSFATPNAVALKERHDPEYRRIFSIVNSEDFVTKCMPKVWDFGRYGVTLVLPKKSDTKRYKAILNNMSEIFFGFYGKKYAPFKNGDKIVNKLITSVFKHVETVDDFYYKKFRSQGEKMSVQQYFEKTLCAIVAEPNSEVSDNASKYMLGTFVGRYTSSPALRAIADFFVMYEGIASATTGKISDTYFTFSHLPQTYCSFMLAIEKEDLIEEETISDEKENDSEQSD